MLGMKVTIQSMSPENWIRFRDKDMRKIEKSGWVYGPDPAGCHGPEQRVCIDSGPALDYSEGQISATHRPEENHREALQD
ncbi:MAG: hypothetical protein EOR72_09205 [Mesorhizobium sp.]|uniref:hypothetical protein n=1 Tax=Mesorhizobium sp. TaxID=1871066 RepID=UPI000FE91751|nr:hypothetical protein [Mesorhizobium sp.]RWM16859.1 MAG: hypothetical protein EOR72_09205 [Mesorhizobium sp.]